MFPAVAAAALSCGMLVEGARAETDTALVADFNAVKQVSGFTPPAVFCRMGAAPGRPVAGAQAYRLTTGEIAYAFFLDPFGRTHYPSGERRAMLAHEIAHTMLPDENVPFWHLETLGEYLARECAADALAAQWVGKDALIAALQRTVRLAGERGSPNISRQILTTTYRELKLKGW